MGWTSYDSNARSFRAASSGYYHKSADDIFTQNKVRKIHESMMPKKALIREARDSDAHPHSLPIIIGLDLTGSMGHIPHELVKDGLPNMVGRMLERGVADPAILFLGIGDHTYDKAPLQVGQFESGDVELDLWLTRTWVEKGGGGNNGESYHLAWYYGANHTVTDAYEKRGQKGFLFTIGDEPCLKTLPKTAVQELMGKEPQVNFTDKELLKAAQEKYEVFHLHIMEGSDGRESLSYWQNLLGQRCIVVEDYTKVGEIIADTVVSYYKNRVSTDSSVKQNVVVDTPKNEKKDEEIIL